MKKPNFFIIGAPKCGTTSMASWLSEHPLIFMSPIKEPHYFNAEHPRHRFTAKLEQYHALFQNVTEHHIAVGEASAAYLYFQESVPNILQYNPEAKFLVMVRNPVDMASSMHDQRCLGLRADDRDFATAWRIQEERANGKKAPVTAGEPELPPYGKMCLLGEQLQRLYSHVTRERVHVTVFDDLTANPRREYQMALEFLGVPDDGRQDFHVHNRAKEMRSASLARLILQLSNLKRRLGINRGLGVSAMLQKLNGRERPRPPLTLEVQQTLITYFKDDVYLLERLIGRDLNGWLA